MNRANIYDLFKQPEDLEEKITQGCEYLKTGRFEKAETVFTDLIEKGGQACEIDTGLVCAKYWNNRISKINDLHEGRNRSDYLLKEWEGFKKFLKQIQRNEKEEKKNISAFDEDIVLLTGHFILSIAIEDLINEFQKKSFPDIDLLVVIGETFLQLNDYKKTIETLEYARVFRKKDPYILALLADGYYGFGEFARAKVLFREAFFLNPEIVPLDKIKCEIIHELIETIKARKHQHTAPWIPVYGMVTGEFDVTKELSEDEASELLIEVQRLEDGYNNKKNQNFLPYLLSKYLYLIDYLEKQVGVKHEADRLKMKIKQLDPKIYNLYINDNE